MNIIIGMVTKFWRKDSIYTHSNKTQQAGVPQLQKLY